MWYVSISYFNIVGFPPVDQVIPGHRFGRANHQGFKICPSTPDVLEFMSVVLVFVLLEKLGVELWSDNTFKDWTNLLSCKVGRYYEGLKWRRSLCENSSVVSSRCNLRNGYHTPINVIKQAHERPPDGVGTPASQKKKRGRRPACQGDYFLRRRLTSFPGLPWIH